MATGLEPEAERQAEAFIRSNLPLTEAPGTGGLRLHLAGPRSGLSRLVPPGGTPYWAHAWPGGVALAAHLLARPEEVAGRSVLDLGAGGGLAAIAAARAGARLVAAADADPFAAVVARLNAAANGVTVEALTASLDGAPKAEVVLAGDLFYDERLARLAAGVLEAWQGGGAAILVGDIGRRFLPRDQLEPLACYPVRDVGDPLSARPREGWVFRWRPNEKGAPQGAL